MRSSFLFFTCFVFLSACQKDGEHLIGHWHMKEYDKASGDYSYGYLTLDFTPEQTVFLNKGRLGNSGIYGRWDRGEKTMAFGTECFFTNYEFNVKSDTLYFFQKDGKEFHGYKCGESCCDKQEDFFQGSLLEMDLPIVKDTSNLTNLERLDNYNRLRVDIQYGLPKVKYSEACPFGPMLFIDENFKFIDDLPYWYTLVIKTYPLNLRDKLVFIVYANHENGLKSLQRIVEELQRLKIKNIYLALREKNYKEELKIWLRKIEPHEKLETIIQQYYKAGDFIETI